MDYIEVLKDYYDRLESLDLQQVILEVKRKVIGQDAFLEEFIPFCAWRFADASDEFKAQTNRACRSWHLHSSSVPRQACSSGEHGV